jgi:hypothetical protein
MAEQEKLSSNVEKRFGTPAAAPKSYKCHSNSLNERPVSNGSDFSVAKSFASQTFVMCIVVLSIDDS